MENDQLKFLSGLKESLDRTLDSKYVQPDELVKVAQTIVSVVREITADLHQSVRHIPEQQQSIVGSLQAANGQIQDLLARHHETESRTKRQAKALSDHQTWTRGELDTLSKSLTDQIEGVRSLAQDDSSVQGIIARVERLETVGESPELIRNKLELLDGDERLDAKAIKNLPQLFKNDKELRVIATNKPFSSLLDVNMAGLAIGQYPKWDGTQWVPGTPSGGGGSTWGSITGTLSSQTDLQTALNAKQGTITLTTIGTGAASFGSNTLNIPTYILPTASTGTLGGVKVDGTTITISGGVISAATGGSGTVSSVSVVSANGFAGTVATPTSTPAITLTTSITGILKGNGTAISAAAAGTDYEVPLIFSSPLVRTVNTISIPAATTSVNGYLTSTDWNTFNGKQGAITLTTTGTSGAATFSGGTLNIPNYTYTLPTASTSVLGGVKVDGTTITITSGVISAAGGSGTVNSGTAKQIAIYASTGTAVSGASNLIFDHSSGQLTVGDSTLGSSLILFGNTSGSVTIGAGGTTSGFLTLPPGTDTIVGRASTDILTNKDLTSGTNTFPTFNQNTTGSAAKWTTARTLAGNSVDGSANVAFANKFIVQGTTDAGLSGAQFLGALGTGIVKNTTTTGVLSIAIASDFPTLNQNTTGSAATLTTARTIGTLTGDVTTAGSTFNGSANNTNATVLATVNANVGSFGSATQVATFTVNGKGLTTAAGNVTITPAVGSITGLGTGVATALAVNVGTAGAPVVLNGAGGTPSSLTLTNATGLPVSGITASTSTALGVGSIELGNASDTTLSRSSAGVLAVEGVVIPSISSTNTLTNKRITKRVLALSAGSATPAINTDSYDVVNITAQSAAITSFTSSLTGTPVDGDTLRISITDNGTARAITWGTSFEASTVALPTTTVISTRLDVGFFWNTATSKWRCVASC